jgi:hypothetical protein
VLIDDVVERSARHEELLDDSRRFAEIEPNNEFVSGGNADCGGRDEPLEVESTISNARLISVPEKEIAAVDVDVPTQQTRQIGKVIVAPQHRRDPRRQTHLVCLQNLVNLGIWPEEDCLPNEFMPAKPRPVLPRVQA